MDARRLLSLAAGGVLLSGCALLRPPADPPAAVEAVVVDSPIAADPGLSLFVPERSATERPYLDVVADEGGGRTQGRTTSAPSVMRTTASAGPSAPPAPPEPPGPSESSNSFEPSERPGPFGPSDAFEPASRARPAPPSAVPAIPPAGSRPTPATGRAAIAEANAEARAASRADAFVGGVQVFAYDPGRVYEVWTAPLRVTTLTLAPGETVTAKAAGDTVRWQIGEAVSGAAPVQRTHVLLKPLERGLETNLVLTTSQRVYLLQLRSGSPDAFNAAVAWDLGAVIPPELPQAATTLAPDAGPAAAAPAGPPDARYRVSSRGRAPRWTPTAVFNDGVRTFIAFRPDLQVDEAPALFLIAPDGGAQMVNYRQQGGLFVVDRVFDRAELRLGQRRPQIVRIARIAAGRGGRP